MTYFCSSFPGSPSSQAIEAATTITVVFPHLSELTLKIGVQFATHRTDQSKLFPVNVLLPYARASYPSHWAISGCFVQIRTASVVQAAEHVLREYNPSSSNQRTGPASRSGCQRCANFLPPWCSANPAILDEWLVITGQVSPPTLICWLGRHRSRMQPQAPPSPPNPSVR